MPRKNKQSSSASSGSNPLPAKVGNVKSKNAKRRNNRSGISGVAGSMIYRSAPTSIGAIVRPQIPQIVTVGGRTDGCIRVSHRELVAELTGSSLFEVTAYSINPGLRGTFPWLGQLSRLYEFYRFQNLVFEFVPSCSSTATGTASMAIDFDAYDTQPADKQGMMSNHMAVSGPVFAPISLGSDRDDLERWRTQRYTRQHTIAANLDIKTYDVGTLFVAFKGQSGAIEAGELYVNYVVDLMTPQDPIWLVDPEDCSCKLNQGASSTIANPFITASKTGDVANQVLEVMNTGMLKFTHPGQYLVDLSLSGTGLTTAVPTFTDVNNLGASFTTIGASLINAAATNSLARMAFNIPVAPCLVSATLAGLVTTLNAVSARFGTYAYTNA